MNSDANRSSAIGNLLTVTLGILAVNAVAAGVPAEFQGPVFLPGDEAIEAAAFNQETPTVAAGGTGFVAVWTDLRTDDSFWGTEQGGRDIYAARLDATGNMIDACPIVVSQTFGGQEQPQVAWNGENWLVVWENQTPTQFFYESRVFATRLAPDGTILDDPPLEVVSGGSSGMDVRVTSNGTDWLVVAQGYDAGDAGIVGVRVSAQGVVLDPVPEVLAPQTYYLFSGIGIHSAQGEYLLTYAAAGQFKAQRLQSDLSPIGAEYNIPGIRLGSNGTNHFIVWVSGGTLVGSTMSPDGSLQNPGGVPIMPATGSEVHVTWDGMNWWVSSLDPIVGLVLARVTAGDGVLDPGGFAYNPAIEDSMQQHWMAGGLAGGVQLLWTDFRVGGSNPFDVYGAFVSADGQGGPDAPVALSAQAQTRPDVTEGPDGFLAVMRSQRSGANRILAQRLDNLGNAVDAEPIEVANGPTISSPAAAWNGSVWLVVWYDFSSQMIFGRRMLPDGNLLDSTPLTIMPGITPDVAALGDTFLVVGTHITFGIVHWRAPFFIRVDGTTGNLLDPEPLQIGNIFAQNPAVTTFAGRWLMTWQRNFSHDDPQGNLHAAFVEPDGTSAGDFVVAYNAFTPDVAASGAAALFVFRKNSTANANNDVAARRMLPDGTFPDPEFILSNSPDRQRAPTVAWDGAQFVAAWEDLVNAEAFFDERTDIYAARITESGQNLDPQGFSVAAASVPETQPVLTSANGHTLLAAPIFRDDAPFTSYRIATFHRDGSITDPPDAAFSGTPLDGCAPLTVDFADESTPDTTSWEWSFGDGAGSSQQHPSHTYADPGTYTVFLTARSALGADSMVKVDYVTTAVPTSTSFQATTATTGCAPLTVQFNDLSLGELASWHWDFGDGTASTEQNPAHTYAWPGTYSVTLTASGECGTDELTRTGYVQIEGACPIRSLALGDISVASSLEGGYGADYTSTYEDDNLLEYVREVLSQGNQYSELDHRWPFEVVPGPGVTFLAKVFRFPSSDGDDFRFEYSTDNTNFVPLFTVDVTGAYSEWSASVPDDLEGTVYVRIVDTDHTPGNQSIDGIYVDYLRFETPVELGCGPVHGLRFADRQQMLWSGAPLASYYDLVRGDLDLLRASASVGDGMCEADDLVSPGASDAETPLPSQGFYYIIRGDAVGQAAGTYDNHPETASPHEGRDGETGRAGGLECTDAP